MKKSLAERIRAKNFRWMKVKAYEENPLLPLEKRHADLLAHHKEETEYLLEVIGQMADSDYWCDNERVKGFCGHIKAMHGDGGCLECDCKSWTAMK